nr:MAG TPA: hypothetical protein [Caudoviricetes sp.]DAW14272.1 MAG TPA: hypothetical protein [Caudoviricetes sp.]
MLSFVLMKYFIITLVLFEIRLKSPLKSPPNTT